MTRIQWLTVALIILCAAPCLAAVAPNGLVILLTDYGADSIYVGTLKGAIYAKFPHARIDSITNSVPSFDIVAGAYVLAEACPAFPRGTTFCCVVDPGVGTERKPIALETQNGYRFVGPDNGLLSLAAQRFGIAELRELANKSLWREGGVSNTFQGRDIFGPVAAALAGGTPLADAGPELKTMTQLEVEESRVEGETLVGIIVRADSYGNLVTNIRGENAAAIGLKKGDVVGVTLGKAQFIAPLQSTYADVPEGQKVVVVQSSGYLECAINKGDLASGIGEGLHARVAMSRGK